MVLLRRFDTVSHYTKYTCLYKAICCLPLSTLSRLSVVRRVKHTTSCLLLHLSATLDGSCSTSRHSLTPLSSPVCMRPRHSTLPRSSIHLAFSSHMATSKISSLFVSLRYPVQNAGSFSLNHVFFLIKLN